MTARAPETLRELADRLEKRAAVEREFATSNAIVRDLLQPQLDAFNRRNGTHNTYAVRLMLDHRNSAAKDEAFANDLEAAIDQIRALAASLETNHE